MVLTAALETGQGIVRCWGITEIDTRRIFGSMGCVLGGHERGVALSFKRPARMGTYMNVHVTYSDDAEKLGKPACAAVGGSRRRN